MKPSAFSYIKAKSYSHVLEVLGSAETVKILAGGQSLVPMMNMRVAKPEVLLDINDIADLQYIKLEDGFVRIGSMTRYAQILKSNVITEKLPLLAAAVGYIGYVSIRNRGTIGGSVVHNDPSAEMGVALSCLGAELVIVNSDQQERTIPISEFFLTTYLTDIAPNELLREICIPIPGANVGWSFNEISMRVGDFAIVNVAALVQLDQGRRVKHVQLAFGGVADTPICLDVDDVVVGSELSSAVLSKAVDRVQEQIDPQDDNVSTGIYKRQLAATMTIQCLKEAAERI